MSKTSSFRASYVGEIPVRLKIEKTDPRLIPDLTGSAEIVLNAESDTLVAPREAVFSENEGSFVFVQSPEGWTRKKVDLGLAQFHHGIDPLRIAVLGMWLRCNVRCSSRTLRRGRGSPVPNYR